MAIHEIIWIHTGISWLGNINSRRGRLILAIVDPVSANTMRISKTCHPDFTFHLWRNFSIHRGVFAIFVYDIRLKEERLKTDY